MKMRHGYGISPNQYGIFEIEPSEMMFWMYCPVKFPDMDKWLVPENIKSEFGEILDFVESTGFDENKYVYVTAKTLFCTPNSLGNRPGWHSDGFATNDINFIWSDSSPTEFAIKGGVGNEETFSVPDDCEKSLEIFEQFGNIWGGTPRGIPNMLYRLDEKVIHRVAPRTDSGMRSFLKISISNHKYNLVGNSRNHLLNYDWDMVKRNEERNHPCQVFEKNNGTPSENSNSIEIGPK